MNIIEELEFCLGELGIELPEIQTQEIGNFVKVKVDNTEYLYTHDTCSSCITKDIVRTYKTEHNL